MHGTHAAGQPSWSSCANQKRKNNEREESENGSTAATGVRRHLEHRSSGETLNLEQWNHWKGSESKPTISLALSGREKLVFKSAVTQFVTVNLCGRYLWSKD
eukprot:3866326-Rhodomonas_salina.3